MILVCKMRAISFSSRMRKRMSKPQESISKKFDIEPVSWQGICALTRGTLLFFGYSKNPFLNREGFGAPPPRLPKCIFEKCRGGAPLHHASLTVFLSTKQTAQMCFCFRYSLFEHFAKLPFSYDYRFQFPHGSTDLLLGM